MVNPQVLRWGCVLGLLITVLLLLAPGPEVTRPPATAEPPPTVFNDPPGQLRQVSWYRGSNMMPVVSSVESGHLSKHLHTLSKNGTVVYSSTCDPLFAFSVPMTALLWKRIVGWDSVVLFFVQPGEPALPACKAMMEETARVSHTVLVFEVDLSEETHLSTFSQMSRLLISSLDIPDNVYLVTTDADMWPIQQHFFTRPPEAFDFSVYYGNYDADFFAMCYLGARVSTWREVMQTSSTSDRSVVGFFTTLVDMIARRRQIAGADWLTSYGPQWYADQLEVTHRIETWEKHGTHLVYRGRRDFGCDRLDRSRWAVPDDLCGVIDAHIVRPAFGSDWTLVFPLLKKLLSASDLDHLQSYHAVFLRAISYEWPATALPDSGFAFPSRSILLLLAALLAATVLFFWKNIFVRNTRIAFAWAETWWSRLYQVRRRAWVILLLCLAAAALVSARYSTPCKMIQKPKPVCSCNDPCRNGTESCVISYAFYGSDPYFVGGALRQVESVSAFFPGWRARFYVDNSVPERGIELLKIPGISEVVVVHNVSRGLIAGMFWRFFVAHDPTVDRFLVRDLDSQLSERERVAVYEWVASGKSFHSIHDNPEHHIPMLGGLWGGRGNIIPLDWIETPARMGELDSFMQKKGGDQHFLKKHVYKRLKQSNDPSSSFLMHDAYHCKKYPDARPFPVQRKGPNDFCGGVFSGSFTDVKKQLQQESKDGFEWYESRYNVDLTCPDRCRPCNKPTWTRC